MTKKRAVALLFAAAMTHIAAAQSTVPPPSDTTISIGTIAGQILTWIAAAFAVPIGGLLVAWLLKLAKFASKGNAKRHILGQRYNSNSKAGGCPAFKDDESRDEAVVATRQQHDAASQAANVTFVGPTFTLT